MRYSKAPTRGSYMPMTKSITQRYQSSAFIKEFGDYWRRMILKETISNTSKESRAMAKANNREAIGSLS
jgi:hypothetical protein